MVEAGMATIVTVTIEERRTMCVIGCVVEEHSVVIPINTPCAPPPAESEERSDGKTDTEIKSWPTPPDAGHVNPIRPRSDWVSVDCPRIVGRDVDHFWVGRDDVDLVMFIFNIQLRGRLEIAGFFGFLPHLLNGLHHIFLLVVISVAE